MGKVIRGRLKAIYFNDGKVESFQIWKGKHFIGHIYRLNKRHWVINVKAVTYATLEKLFYFVKYSIKGGKIRLVRKMYKDIRKENPKSTISTFI